MARDEPRRLTAEEAKARLRQAARGGAAPGGGGALGDAGALGEVVRRGVNRRPLAAVGIALLAGAAFGAWREVRVRTLSTLLRLLD